MNGLKTLAISFLLLAFPHNGNAEETGNPGQIDFVIMEQMPYGAKRQDSKIFGYLVEIAQLLLSEAGFESQVRITPLRRLVMEGKAQEFDCTIIGDTPLAKTFLQ